MIVRRSLHVLGLIPLLVACATALPRARPASEDPDSPESSVPQRVVAAVGEAYPSGRIVAACRGRLVPGSSVKDWALVIHQPDRHLLMLTAYRGDGTGPLARLEVQRRGAPAEHVGQQELRCLTTEESRQINVTLQESEGVHGRLLPADGLDLFCHSDSEPAFNCYQVDVRTGRFRSVGGWVT